MNSIISYILILTSVLLILSFDLRIDDKDEKSIIGTFYRNNGTDNAEFTFDSLNCFKYYHWCDICPFSEIYGKWSRIDSLIILTDTIVLTINSNNGDSIMKNTHRTDTLYLREINEKIFLCHKLSDKLLNKSNDVNKRSFGCYKKE